ncbi:MAG: hypothetical protein WCS89_03545 [Candidatus Paceibacterota bacterium]
MITYEEFKKVEIRAGKIISAEKIPDTDKLLKLMVDFGEMEEVKTAPAVEGIVASIPAVEGAVKVVEKVPKFRQIVSGIALKFPDTASLVGKTCMFVTNLEPRTIKGYESNGMIFAVSTNEGGFSLLEPNSTIPAGTLAA